MNRRLLFGLVATVAASAAAQEAPFDAAAAFGERESVQQVSLSPDGKYLAMITAVPGGAGERVEVVPVAGGRTVAVLNGGSTQRITHCGWSAPTRLYCSAFAIVADGGPLFGMSRMFAVDADGRNMRQLTAETSSRATRVLQNGGTVADLLPDESSGEVLMTRTVVPEGGSDTRMTDRREGLALERLNTTTLARKYVQQPRPDAVEYITDGHGSLRIIGERPTAASGYDATFVHYCYRAAGGGGGCNPLSVRSAKGGFDPFAVDRDLNVAYGFDRHEGRLALFKIALDPSLKRELVLADPRVDVDGLIRIGRQRRVVGASFATERRQVVMFDPELKRLSASLARALPNLPNVSFVDATVDESKLLMVASSDNDPGRYYVFDKKTRELNEIVQVRPQLAGVTLATVKPVTFPAADGTRIPGYLTLPPGSSGKNLPAIVMPHGGPGARDEWGFDWWAQYFANRGFAVLQPNFRGSTGYGDAWFRDNGIQSWRIAIGDVNDGGKWLTREGIAAPGKLAIVGWSYGGYAALQSAVLDPDLFKAIVAVAPVTDLETMRNDAMQYTSFAAVDALIGRGPHVREGSPAQNVASIRAPVLMFHGDRDLNVGVNQSRIMDRKLKAAGKPVEFVLYPGLDHQLNDGKARTDMLRKSDAFLRKSLGL